VSDPDPLTADPDPDFVENPDDQNAKIFNWKQNSMFLISKNAYS
jgi:hypothetical protein